jgi:hypothetical protein
MESTSNIIESIFGNHPQAHSLTGDITKFTNEYIDLYVKKKNNIILLVDKRDLNKKRVYANLSIALHNLKTSITN